MPGKYLGKYRNDSIRLQKWDYSWDAAYFVTICTKNRIHYFGEIEEGKMTLAPAGILADVFWHEIKNHAKNVEPGAFVVMPNHVHGILNLNGNVCPRHALGQGSTVGQRSTLNQPPTLGQRSPLSQGSGEAEPRRIANGQQRFQNIGKNSLSSIIGSYKSAVTKHARRLGYEFAWQPLFYEHIIRDDGSFQRIENYIINNPKNWKEDKFTT